MFGSMNLVVLGGATLQPAVGLEQASFGGTDYELGGDGVVKPASSLTKRLASSVAMISKSRRRSSRTSSAAGAVFGLCSESGWFMVFLVMRRNKKALAATDREG